MSGIAETQSVPTGERLIALRKLMAEKDHNVDAYLVASEDQHSSEYLAECDRRRAFITGFTGSAGTALITQKEALLFTDGRYFLQARQQMDNNWELMKQGIPKVPTWQEYLVKNLPEKSRIGVDASLVSYDDAKKLEAQLKEKSSTLVPLPHNLIDRIWKERPSRPQNQIFPLPVEYAGKSSKDKITQLREYLESKKASATVVSMLDEVAWLFNLRGSDIEYNPVFFSYAIVTKDSVKLFVGQSCLDSDALKTLEDGKVEVLPYEDFFETLSSLQLCTGEEKVLLGGKASLAIANAIGRERILSDRAPVADFKSLKNEKEIDGFRNCHIRDGTALVRYFAWLEQQLEAGAKLSESQAADKLEQYRSELDLFVGLSFPTISSTGPNGAIIHYQPDPNDCAVIKKDQIYLCDSGAQFRDGTTDVTRTLHFGEPTAFEKRAFTRVLQGHIAIATSVFPKGTTGYLLDPFARQALWKDGLDYRHGTGHGIGHFLNVHEGPQGMGVRIAYNDTELKAGMTLSNEPGYYEDGKFGIRLENIVIVQSASPPNNFGEKGWLKFENVTMCPMHRKLIEKSLLTPDELTWVNAYHKEVVEKVGALLNVKNEDDLRAKAWLERECKPL